MTEHADAPQPRLGHSGPSHEEDCRHVWSSEAACGCRRTEWLDETVTRAQARAELLTQLDRWAREQIALETRWFDRPQIKTAWPDHESERAQELLSYAAGCAYSITNEHYQRLAVAALNMRRECMDRGAEVTERGKPQPRPEPQPEPREALEPTVLRPIETVAVQETLL